MKSNRVVVIILSAGFAVILLSCNLPGAKSPTPFVFPTPNLTMTALFKPLTTGEATSTDTPVDETLTPTREATQRSIPPTPTETPTPTLFTPTSTATSLIPTPTVSYQGPGQRSGSSIAAEYLVDRPKIDGYLTEWESDIYPLSHVVYGADRWDDDDDLYATVMVAWDESNIYLGARVRDDNYVQNSTGRDLYLGDSVELLLDTDVASDFYLNSLSGDDFQLGISPGSIKKDTDPEAYLWFPRAKEGSRGQVEIGVVRTSNGYHIELAVPWGIFEVEPHSGQHFGFAFSVSDNDSGNQEVQQSMISNSSTRSLTQPMTWGDLTLTK